MKVRFGEGFEKGFWNELEVRGKRWGRKGNKMEIVVIGVQ